VDQVDLAASTTVAEATIEFEWKLRTDTTGVGPKTLRCNEKRRTNYNEKPCGGKAHRLVAGATATATASATSTKPPGGASRAVGAGRGENGELNRSFPAGALRTGNFLLLVDDNFLETLVATVADVFVDRHDLILGFVGSYPPNYSIGLPGSGGREHGYIEDQ
jgi:hypothetical protein